MSLSSAELDTARAVLDVLTQEKYKNKMYLFLQPLNINEVPGYFDIVPHKRFLDVHTVRSNLESYPSLGEFWRDVQGIFENAIAYHQDRESSWIAKMAKDMLKVVKKEKQKREIGQSVLSTPPEATEKKKTFKIKLASKPVAAADVVAAPVPSEATATASTSAQSSLNPSIGTSKTDDKKAIKAKPTQPKFKLKLSLGNKAKKEPATVASGATPNPPDVASAQSTTVAAATVKPAAATTSKPKISLKFAGTGSNSRGKELPKGVAVAAAASSTPAPVASASSQPPAKKQKKAKAPTGPSSSIITSGKPPKTPGVFPAAQALKVLAGLRRRGLNKSIAWFLQPVSDKAILPDYKAKVKHPSDIGTMTAKVEKGAYTSIAAMVLDLRRIFGNCLIFNTNITKDSLRSVAVDNMQMAEDLLKVFFRDYSGSYPPLLYCWKLCLGVLDTLYNLTNPSDGQPTAIYFQHPVSYYCGGQFPVDYHQTVSKPMDFGTVTAKLMEAKYQSVDDFCNDCRLVITNCINYYTGRPDGIIFIDQANRLNDLLSQQIEQLSRYVRSARGAADQAKSNAPVVLPQPSPPLLLDVLQGLRAIQYTDKATRISEPLMGPFEKPVSSAVFPDYLEHIKEPMDLSLVERKVKAGSYMTPEDFEYDINLIFRNCEKYNTARGGDHLVSMSKYGARQFRKLFYEKAAALDDPTFVPEAREESNEKSAEASAMILASPTPGGTTSTNVDRAKAVPRISISAAQLSLAAAKAKSPSQPLKKSNLPPAKQEQAVPLHIAIARVKEAFPLRRQIKGLQEWEADCAKYFKELMRHPWISAARPTFIFTIPVPVLFPSLREAYAAKVRKPMDLTEVECALLAGNRYATPEDFLSEIALVFANAVRFNRDGKDLGEPISSAYYDASIHLLRYSRWLSLELLSKYADKSDHIDDDSANGLPPFVWRLTEGNKCRAREEMEKLVFSEPIDKSLEGDRYTWQELECEKLLKSLRHQSDLRYMTFFIQPNYPADYTAYISKPMDWERVNRTLKKRHYDKFGDIVADLRLIFSNALKYNGRLKGTDTVSGRAYESATIMSMKLESAINKMLLTVSDRLERERIDHANAMRAMEAEDRADEARIRAAWKKEADAPSGDGSAPEISSTVSSQAPDVALQKIRLIRRANQRRESMDFEIPYFDEEDTGKHESSHFEVVKRQKALFEKQRQEQIKMRQHAASIGSLVFARMLQHDLAVEWEETELQKLRQDRKSADDADMKTEEDGSTGVEKPSEVLKELGREDRSRLQIKLSAAPKSGKKRSCPPPLSLE